MTDQEAEAVERFVQEAHDTLGEALLEVWSFGPIARGDRRLPGRSMRSDIDILVLTREGSATESRDALVDATYSLLLMCGTQISPRLRPRTWRTAPPTAAAADLVRRLGSHAPCRRPADRAGERFGREADRP